MAYYTFHNKKIFEAFKALYETLSGCRDQHEPQGLKLMRFYFKDKWRNKEQDSISTAVHPGPELSSSSRARAVRKARPAAPPSPEAGRPSPVTPPHSPPPAAVSALRRAPTQLRSTAAPGFIILAGRLVP